MNANIKYCQTCGAALAAEAQTCINCGTPVPQSSATLVQPPAAQRPFEDPFALPASPVEPTQAAQGYSAPAAPPAAPRRGRTLWWILGGGCALLLCLGFGLFAVLALLGPQVSNIFSGITETLESPTVDTAEVVIPTTEILPTLTEPATATAEVLPMPTEPILEATATATAEVHIAPTQEATAAPSATLPASSGAIVWPDPIGQQRSDTYFTDDFTDNTYDWAVDADDISSFGLEDGHYAMRLLDTQYSIWAYLPVDFNPRVINFDAAVVPGQDIGAYGVLCFYQDSSNYHSISIDPLNREVSIGQVVDNDWVSFLADDWVTTDALKPSPYEVNSIQVTCDPDLLTLFINNTFVAQVEITNPGGDRAALMLETWDDLAQDGFKALFDNLVVFIPQQ